MGFVNAAYISTLRSFTLPATIVNYVHIRTICKKNNNYGNMWFYMLRGYTIHGILLLPLWALVVERGWVDHYFQKKWSASEKEHIWIPTSIWFADWTPSHVLKSSLYQFPQYLSSNQYTTRAKDVAAESKALVTSTLHKAIDTKIVCANSIKYLR